LSRRDYKLFNKELRAGWESGHFANRAAPLNAAQLLSYAPSVTKSGSSFASAQAASWPNGRPATQTAT